MSILLDPLTEKKEMKEVPLSEILIERPPKTAFLAGLKVGAVLTLVFALAALGAGGYLLYSVLLQQKEQASLEANQVQVSERVKALEEQVNKLRSDSEGMQQNFQSLSAANAELGEGFEEFRFAFNDLGNRTGAAVTSGQNLAVEVQKLQAGLESLQASLASSRD